MSSEYYLNGAPLDDPEGRWLVMDGTLLPSIASPVNISVTIPRRDGILPMPTTSYGPATVTIAFMVQDTVNGRLGGGRGALDANFNLLLSRLRFRDALAPLGYYPAGGESRSAMVRLQSISSPVYYHPEKIIEITAVFEIPSGAFRSDHVYTMPDNDLSQLDGGAMPILDPLFKLVPTKTSVVIEDAHSRSKITWNGPLKAGKHLVIDPDSYWAEWTDGAWEGGEDASSGLSITSRGFRLTPDLNGHYASYMFGGSGQVRAQKVF